MLLAFTSCNLRDNEAKSRQTLTEIDFLNGKILKIATDFGIRVTFKEFLTYFVKSLEKSEN